LNGKLYAAPHWLCRKLLISRDPKVAYARDIPELERAVEEHGASSKIAGLRDGSDSVAALYFDRVGKDAPTCVSNEFDPQALEDVSTVVSHCGKSGCEPDRIAEIVAFAKGHVAAYHGFSEELSLVRKIASDEQFRIGVIPLGKSNRRGLYVDGFGLRTGCDSKTEEFMGQFARFICEPRTMQTVLLSEDIGPNGVPRYPIAATQDIYSKPAMLRERYHRRICELIRDGYAYPSLEYHSLRSRLDRLPRPLAA